MRPFRTLLAACLAAALAAAPPAGPDRAGMDGKVAPGDDFFAYANGTWERQTVIPPDLSSAGPSPLLEEQSQMRVRELLAGAAKAAPGSEARKAAEYYRAFMDEAAIEKLGLAPLEPALKLIAGTGDKLGLSGVLGGTLRADVDVLNNGVTYTPNLFGLWVAQDLDDPIHYTPFLLQGGLGLPDRDYYLDDSDSMKAIRGAYLAHIEAMLRLAGQADPAAKAALIMALERRIAEVHVSSLDSNDPAKGNNHWTPNDFTTRAKGIDWKAFFLGAGLRGQVRFVVWQPSALIGIAGLVQSEPLDTWKAWLTYHAIEKAAPYLGKAFVAENFAFQGGVLQGTPQLRERWKLGVEAVNAALGDAVGRLYVEKFFPPADKARVEAMVRNLLTAFGRRIDALDWMSPATKAKARAKLASLKVGIGYPDHWRDYSGLEVSPVDAYGNAERAELFDYRRNLAKLRQPVDRGEWVMTPQTINAVNLPAMNALNFPAGILQAPYFEQGQTEAMAYGAIGATIGHEISHSFDDLGAQFDAQGRLKNWWTDEDLTHFQRSGAALVKQFDGYRPFPDLAVSGQRTLGENIADVAGLAAAYDAYHLALAGRSAPKAGGFTGDQQFFLSFAQSWREKRREQALRKQILTDVHAPERYRVFTVRNLDPWYPAFGVKPGQQLYLAPADRVKVW